jgi:hypothetical protein
LSFRCCLIPVEFDHSGIYTGMVPGMAFPGMGRNGIPLEFQRNSIRISFVYLLLIVYLFVRMMFIWQPNTATLCFPPTTTNLARHHHRPLVTAHNGLNITVTNGRHPHPSPMPTTTTASSATSPSERAPATLTRQKEEGGFQVPRRRE